MRESEGMDIEEIRKDLAALRRRLAKGEIDEEVYRRQRRLILEDLTPEEQRELGTSTPEPAGSGARLGPSGAAGGGVRTALPSLADLDLEPGTVLFGQWRIERELGRGGFGVVFEAHELLLDERQAVKVLDPAMVARAELLARFRREVALMRKLIHPRIVRVYDYREDLELSQALIGMEYVPGGSVKDLGAAVRATAAPLPLILAILGQTLEALCVAHTQGVIHRDVTPGNVLLAGGPPAELLAEPGRDPGVKLVDFGIAALAQRSELSQKSRVLGTAAYVAPEILDPTAGEPQPAADVYGCGAVAYELLTGEPPLGRFERPSALRSGLPASVEDLVMAMLSRRPQQRPSSAQALADCRKIVSSLEQAEKRSRAEAEAKRRAEEAEKRRQAEVAAKRTAEAAEKRRQAEVEAKRRAEKAEKLRQAEVEAKRKAEEEERKRQAEAETRFQAEEEEKQRRAEAEARFQAEEEEKRRQAEVEAKRKADEEEGKRQAETEARFQAEEEEKRRAEAEARRKTEEEKRRQAEAEAEARRQAEAKKKVEEEENPTGPDPGKRSATLPTAASLLAAVADPSPGDAGRGPEIADETLMAPQTGREGTGPRAEKPGDPPPGKPSAEDINGDQRLSRARRITGRLLMWRLVLLAAIVGLGLVTYSWMSSNWLRSQAEPGIYMRGDGLTGDLLTTGMIEEVRSDGDRSKGVDRPYTFEEDVQGACLTRPVSEGDRLKWSDLTLCD